MQRPKIALFDLDDTLAESFMPPKPEMIERLRRVLDHMPLAIITGRDFDRVVPDFLSHMEDPTYADRFFVFTESSAQAFGWAGREWRELYTTDFDDKDRTMIHKAINEALEETKVLEGLSCFGQQFIEKRGQTAFAALGLEVPRDLKYSWDPGNVRRAKLRDAVAVKLPDYEVLFGGATSIDVTRKGVNKTYGVYWLSKQLNIPTTEMLYVGDALGEDGNDHVVLTTGVNTIQTSGPEETLTIIDELLKMCAA